MLYAPDCSYIIVSSYPTSSRLNVAMRSTLHESHSIYPIMVLSHSTPPYDKPQPSTIEALHA